MKIKNSLLIEKINQAITSYNEETEKEQIYLITNEKILDEDLKKIRFFGLIYTPENLTFFIIIS